MLGAYSVSKTALLGLCKMASIELAADNIRVNCVAPGIIETKFSSMVGISNVKRLKFSLCIVIYIFVLASRIGIGQRNYTNKHSFGAVSGCLLTKIN